MLSIFVSQILLSGYGALLQPGNLGLGDPTRLRPPSGSYPRKTWRASRLLSAPVWLWRPIGLSAPASSHHYFSCPPPGPSRILHPAVGINRLIKGYGLHDGIYGKDHFLPFQIKLLGYLLHCGVSLFFVCQPLFTCKILYAVSRIDLKPGLCCCPSDTALSRLLSGTPYVENLTPGTNRSYLRLDKTNASHLEKVVGIFSCLKTSV